MHEIMKIMKLKSLFVGNNNREKKSDSWITWVFSSYNDLYVEQENV